MSYMEPVDTQVMKKIGLNVLALVAVAFALIGIVASVT